MAYEPRKGEKRPKINKKIRRLKKELDGLIRSIHGKERRFRIYPLSKKFYFHLSEASRAWYEGAPFTKILRITPIDEGSIVRYFRMSMQVLREMATSEAISKKFKEKLYLCRKRINRDVVDARKQLQETI